MIDAVSDHFTKACKSHCLTVTRVKCVQEHLISASTQSKMASVMCRSYYYYEWHIYISIVSAFCDGRLLAQKRAINSIFKAELS